MRSAKANDCVAIACGGTGGHLFPGLAVARELLARGARPVLLVSPKEIDQLALRTAADLEVLTLPAVGLTRGNLLHFARGFFRSWSAARAQFRTVAPAAVLAMGGFTAAPPVLVGKRLGACTFLHESNAVPGRANRWLSRTVDHCFIGFPSAARRLHSISTVTGTPVRGAFTGLSPETCRQKLNLDPDRPVLLVMGGSQGASAINQLLMESLPLLQQRFPDLQYLHTTGTAERDRVAQAYAGAGCTAQVHGFLADMPSALGAATAAVSRAGASSLAEIAAMQIPTVLIPFPAAVDNHQYLNARAFVDSGAAALLIQADASPHALSDLVAILLQDPVARQRMRDALKSWHVPAAAECIAEMILDRVGRQNLLRAATPSSPVSSIHAWNSASA